MRGYLEDALMLSNGSFLNWAGNSTITYTFLNFLPAYYGSSSPFATNFRAFNSLERAYALHFMAEAERIADVDFVEMEQNSAGDPVGNVTFAFSSWSDTSVAGQVASATDPDKAGDVWLHLAGGTTTEDLITVLHEGGHALGLRHSFYDTAGRPSYYTSTPSENEQWAVMSYTPFSGYSHLYGGHPTGLQLYDIAALQSIYGPSTGKTTGNSVYAITDSQKTYVIWDENDATPSIDKLDLSTTSLGHIVDLRPGYFSSVFQADRNLAIAFGAYIEDIHSGTGNDVLVGNLLTNTIKGGSGNDRIYGEGRLRFDATGDEVGDGDYRRVLKTGVEEPPAGVVEFVDDPTRQEDKLFGENGDDELWGGRGDDRLDGGIGNNLLYGWSGEDTAVYGGFTSLTGVQISIAAASGTDSRITANNNKPDPDAETLVEVTRSGDVDALVDIETIELTHQSDTVILTGDVGALDAGDLTIDMGLSEVDYDQDVVDASAATVGVYINLGTGTVMALDHDTDNGYFGWLAERISVTFRSSDLTVVNGNQAEGTEYSDYLVASAGAEGSGEGYSALYGGGGNDLLVGGGWESHLYGGDGDDQFSIGANTWIGDGEKNDLVTYYGVPIFGGVKQWWMSGNTAYWSPFSSIASAFVTIGGVIMTAVAALVDVPLMKFAAFERTFDGDLVIHLGWGHGGKAVIENYEVDLAMGGGTAGVTVFQNSPGWIVRDGFSLEKFMEYVNLAVNAGFGKCLPGFDPLVFDLDGDGYELVGERISDVYFEFDMDSFAERTGWVHADDGLLAIDLNANGKIDDITELFGNQTTSGFTMLAAYDLNADGVINAADAVFANLRIWRDLDQDGITDSGELQTLAAAGIASISLASTEPAEPSEVAGNTIARTGSFTRTDGSTGGVADVAFQINETATRWLGDSTVSAAAGILPELMGFGEVTGLRVAMTADATLLDMVDDFAALTTTDLAVLKAGAEAILYRWAAVDGVAADAIGTNGFDARKLAFLERYSGYELMPRDTNGDVLTTNIDEMEALWADQAMRLTLRLVVQGPMADAFDGISYRDDIDLLVADTPTALADLYARLLDDLPADPGDALAVWQAWAPLLGAMADGMTRSDSNLVRGDYIAVQLYAAMDGIDQPLDFATLAGALGLTELQIGSAAGETLARGAADGTIIYLSEGGTDILDGGWGQDVYIFGREIGHVTINDEEGKPAGDRIRFAFLTAEEVTLVRSGYDLLITVIATGETVRVTGQFAPVVPLGPDTFLSGNKGIEEIEFGDGGLYEIPDIMTAVGAGSDGDDDMAGTMHSDVLIGGLGDDLLRGGDDADLYVINAGEGHDIIREVQTTVLLRAADMVIFGDGIGPSDLVFARTGSSGDDLLVTIGASGQTLLVEDQFGYTSLGYNDRFAPNARIEAFGFRDHGEGWGIKDLQEKLIADATTAGNDETRGFGDDDKFAASAGNDLLIGMDGQDLYQWRAGAGNDTIDERSRYIDINVGLAGLSLTLDADTIGFVGLVLADLAFSRPTAADNLVATILSTGETLTIVDQFAGFQTGMLGAQWQDRIEWFGFADGTRISWQAVLADITTGGNGDDSLWGDLYADRMEGGLGNDVLSGEGYADTYVFGLGDGHDIIADNNQSILGDGFVTPDTDPDVLELGPGIAQSDVSFERDGDDITLVIGAGGDRVTLQGQDDYFHTGVFGAISYNRIERIDFDDGSSWTWQEINRRIIAAATTSGNDITYGFTMADRFEASAGNDELWGGNSGDTYVFGEGSGHDIVRENVTNVLYGDFDVVEFGPGVLESEVAFSRSGKDLVVTLATGDTLTIVDEFDYQNWFTYRDIELFRFADGTERTKADIQIAMLASTAGDDHLIGFGSDDVLDGGAGNDILEGADGADTYRWGLGSGNDIIREWRANSNLSENDRLDFGAGITFAGLDFDRDGDNLIITIIATGETLTIEGQFDFVNWYAWEDVDRFYFADGTMMTEIEIAAAMLGGSAGDDHLIGTFRSDTLDGGAGNDILEGGDGADRYMFGLGYGQDEIRETLSNANLSENDQLEFGAGITLADLGFARDGTDLIITVIGTTDSLRIDQQFKYTNWYTWWDIDRFVFADGTILAKEDVQQIILTPTAGDDYMPGFMTGDTIDGGSGNDVLEGGDGGDTYVFGRGYGQDVIIEDVGNANLSENDTIRFGPDIAWEDLQFSRSGNTLVITIAGTTDTLTIGNEWKTINDSSTATWWDVENFVLADGTAYTKTDVQIAILQSLSTDGDDTITGFYSADTFDGGLGNDLLEGGRGGDTFIHNVGDGHDTISDYVNNWGSTGDRLLLGAGITTADVVVRRSATDSDDMVLTILGGQSSVTLKNQITGGKEWTLDLVEFADGTIWTRDHIANLMTSGAATSGDDVIDGTSGIDQLSGGGGNDILRGLGGDDRLDGGAGDDRLEGSSGTDVYVYNAGGGNDVLSEYTNHFQGTWGRIEFGEGISPDDVRFAVGASAGDMLLTFASMAGSVLIENQIDGGEKWGIYEVRFADGTIWSAETLGHLFTAALVSGGDDLVTGTWRDDIIEGGLGNDTLKGAGGEDLLVGGAGDDRLEGSSGTDVYVYNPGDGSDVISEYTNHFQGTWGRLEFGAGIDSDDIRLALGVSAGDMLITFDGMAGSVLIENQIDGGEKWGIYEIRFADGTVWSSETLGNLLIASLVSAGDDIVTGSWRNDVMEGGLGNDTLKGAGGNDLLVGGTGNDRLEGAGGNDIYRYALGDGHDVVSEFVITWGSSDVIELGAGITAASVGFLANSADVSDMILTFAGGTGSILIDNQILGGEDWGVDQVKFADGTIWNAATLLVEYIARQGSAGNDFIAGTNGGETLNGGDGGDTIRGLAGNDILNGGDGDDILLPETGVDTVNGGAGWDMVDVSAHTAAMTVDLALTTNHANLGTAGTESWNDVEGVIAGSGADTLHGTAVNNRLEGRNGVDAIYGRDGNDVLVGGASDDTLDGGLGDDVFLVGVGDGSDYISGGDGTDTILASAAGAVILFRPPTGVEIISGGGFANVTLAGTSSANTFDFSAYTLTGIARIDGLGGNDILTGSAGADTIAGGTGDDTLNGGDGDDVFQYGVGDGTDTVNGGAGHDMMVATAANAAIALKVYTSIEEIGGGGFAGVTLSGTSSANSVDFSAITLTGIARIDGFGGNDTLTGSAGADTIAGGTGDDTLNGGGGGDVFQYGTAGDGYDYLNGGDGTDTLVATGNNVWIGIRSMASVEAISAGGFTGVTVWGSTAADTLDFSGVTLTGIDKIDGYEGNDTLTGSAGNDVMVGGLGNDAIGAGGGNDTIVMGAGVDSVDGGAGTDLVDSAYLTTNLYVDLGQATKQARFADGSFETWANVESVLAGSGADRLVGTADANRLAGGGGADRLTGLSGNDQLEGEAGDDVLIGGLGNDALAGGDGADHLLGDFHQATGANLIVNGSFEETSGTITTASWGISAQTIPGWTKTNTSVFELVNSGHQSVYATDSGHWLDLDGAGSNQNMDISQTVAGQTAGAVLELRFDSANWTTAASGSFDVLWNGTVIASINATGAEMRSYVYYVTAVAGDNVVGFRGTGSAQGNGAGIDNVRLFATVTGDGDDTLAGGAGNDILDGGAGTDTADYGAATGAWTINLAAASNQAQSGAETDTLIAIENATGGSGADTITGTSGANVLGGSAGNDRITGGGGNDNIQGGLDTDVVVFAGLQASYSIATVGGAIQIVDNDAATDGDDGTDTLAGVEIAEFQGGVQVGLSAPIVLDLDGDGVDLVGSAASAARFDWNGDGILDDTGWIGQGDGILVYDRNQDGNVSNAREMSFLDDKAGARSDLDGLSAFDSNGDGLFSDADQAWADFRIWRDTDLDGAVDGGELVTMAGAGIASLSLAGAATNRQWAWGENIVVNNGQFTRADGSQSALADVAFSYAPGRAEPAAPFEPTQSHGGWRPGGRLLDLLHEHMTDAPRTFFDRIRRSAALDGDLPRPAQAAGDDGPQAADGGRLGAHVFDESAGVDGGAWGFLAVDYLDPLRGTAFDPPTML